MEVRLCSEGRRSTTTARLHGRARSPNRKIFQGKILNSQAVVSLHKGNFNVETTAERQRRHPAGGGERQRSPQAFDQR